MTIIEDGWQGGRFDATAIQNRAAVNQIARTCTIGAMSEAVNISAPDDWMARGRECKVLWNNTVWRQSENGVLSLPTPEWVRGTRKTDSVDLTWVLVTHRRRKVKLARVAGHFPAHLVDRQQKAAHDAALKQLGKTLEALYRKTGADELSCSLDLNLDLRLQRNRDKVERVLRGTGLHLVVPPRGTYGQRKIDCFIVSSGLYTRHMFDKRKGFDHQGWWLRYHAECAT